jgi:hypothetical protein
MPGPGASEVDVDEHPAVIAGTPIFGFVECSNVDSVGERCRGEDEVKLSGRRLGRLPIVVEVGTHRLSGGSSLGQGDA